MVALWINFNININFNISDFIQLVNKDTFGQL